MFSTRLNPTKPAAAHRAILERVGAACRELRPIEQECWASGRPNEQIQPIFDKHGVLKIGVPVDQSGAGDDSLLLALAAERIGREGLRPLRWFALQTTAGYVARFRAAAEGATAESLSPVNSPSADASQDAEATIHGLLELDDLLWRPTGSDVIRLLNLEFCLAAGWIGVIADCLETMAAYCAGQIQAAAPGVRAGEIEDHLAQTARDLEATRAIVYAAAELKSEFDRRPHHAHLRLEAGTLISEAFWVSGDAVARMCARTRELTPAGKPLADCLPWRHRALVQNYADAFPRSFAHCLAKHIARYYLSD